MPTGTLDGDVKVVGHGDPTIGGRFHDGHATAVIDEWATDLKRAGVKTIRGNLIFEYGYMDIGVHPSDLAGRSARELVRGAGVGVLDAGRLRAGARAAVAAGQGVRRAVRAADVVPRAAVVLHHRARAAVHHALPQHEHDHGARRHAGADRRRPRSSSRSRIRCSTSRR